MCDLDKEQFKASRFANRLPLCLASFCFTCLRLALINARLLGVTELYLLDASLFFGEAVVLLSGLLNYCVGYTFALTVLAHLEDFELVGAV